MAIGKRDFLQRRSWPGKIKAAPCPSAPMGLQVQQHRGQQRFFEEPWKLMEPGAGISNFSSPAFDMRRHIRRASPVAKVSGAMHHQGRYA